MRKPQFLILLFLALLAMTIYMFWERHVNYEDIVKIQYEYNSAPVSPEYQFDYFITITPNSISYTVTNYDGETTESKQIVISESDFIKIRNFLDDADIVNCENLNYDCDGGDHMRMYGYNASGEQILQTQVYRCGNNSTKCGNIDEFYDFISPWIANPSE